MILEGQLAPGEHLQEIPLSEQMGVSRTPIRAALSVLGQEGLLDYRPKRGHVVRRFTLEEVIDAYELRAMLEGMAARLAAERGLSPAGEQRLRAALARGDEILAGGKLTDEGFVAWRDMNESFHTEFLEASRNRSLIEATARTLNVPMVSARTIHWDEFEPVRRSHDYHHLIFSAVVAGQGLRAEATMREHIYQSIDIVRVKWAEILARGETPTIRAVA
jgi:GntR family transcriptional regulator of vanillate catabolism